MGAIVGASITYRLAFGPNAGRKALTLQTVPVRTEQRKATIWSPSRRAFLCMLVSPASLISARSLSVCAVT